MNCTNNWRSKFFFFLITIFDWIKEWIQSLWTKRALQKKKQDEPHQRYFVGSGKNHIKGKRSEELSCSCALGLWMRSSKPVLQKLRSQCRVGGSEWGCSVFDSSVDDAENLCFIQRFAWVKTTIPFSPQLIDGCLPSKKKKVLFDTLGCRNRQVVDDIHPLVRSNLNRKPWCSGSPHLSGVSTFEEKMVSWFRKTPQRRHKGLTWSPQFIIRSRVGFLSKTNSQAMNFWRGMPLWCHTDLNHGTKAACSLNLSQTLELTNES